MSGEEFRDIGQMLEKMQVFVEQTETTLQASREKVAILRQQYETLTSKGSDLKQSLDSLKQQVADAEPTELAMPVVAETTDVETKPEPRVLKPQYEEQPLKQTSVKHEPTDRSYLRK